MGQSSPQMPLSPTAQVRWRRAADELLIDAIFGDLLRADLRAARLTPPSVPSPPRKAPLAA